MTSDAIIIEGCGKRLAEARAVQSLSVAEVAGQLKFSSRQIEAMEAEDWDQFPARVTLRGFLRAYAQHLGLDPASLFVAADSAVAVADPLTPETTGIRFSGNGARIWFVVIPVLTAAFFVLVMGLYAWLSQGADNPLPAEPLTEVVPVATPPDTSPSPAGVPATFAPPSALVAPATQSVAETPVAPQLAAPVPAPAAKANVTPSALPKASGLVFTTTADAWVEVTDATNQRVRRLARAGESTRIEGTPPYKLVVGNAAHVSLQYNNKSIDLKPHIGEKVARLTLE